ncbi:MAG: 4Fe-4S dicluster domain-containing protein [Acidobacteria bacterium]|nr:4Fe-4S dicluster domain-containing protein [Acidobacteriota bacterium]
MPKPIQDRVAELLEGLDGFVALRKTAAGVAPHLFRKGDDVSGLVLAPRYPLASVVGLIHKRHPAARIGVVARACDVRALVEMATRRQVDPGQLFLLAVACDGETAEACHCDRPGPGVDGWPHAEVMGTPGHTGTVQPLLAGYDALTLPERRAFWQRQFLKCIKCYGCRNICPECFCEQCTLEDETFVEKGVAAPPFPMYHLVRAMHMASRCVGCHLCEGACPAGIPLTVLYALMRRDVEKRLDFVPGESLSARPPLSLSLADGPLHLDE